MLAACAGQTPSPSEPVIGAHGAPVRFRYDLVDGKGELSSAALAGRTSILIFITTYDLASQAEARFLEGVVRRHGARINAAAIVLEPPANRLLVQAFRDGLRLDYPVAIGDDVLIAGGGPFGDVHAVPSTVILDAEGRMVWKRVGLVREEELEAAVVSVRNSASP